MGPDAAPPRTPPPEQRFAARLAARQMSAPTSARTAAVTVLNELGQVDLAVYRAIADDPERTAALDAELAGLARRHVLGAGSTAGTPGNQSTAMEWEYLLLTARKRP